MSMLGQDFGEAWSTPSLTLMRTALWFGAGFIASALVGFVPEFTYDGHLLGIFRVTALSHLLHLLTGATALVAGFTSLHASKLYLRWLGSIYGLLALFALFFGHSESTLHISPLGLCYGGIAGTALYHGFGEWLWETARCWTAFLSRHLDRATRLIATVLRLMLARARNICISSSKSNSQHSAITREG